MNLPTFRVWIVVGAIALMVALLVSTHKAHLARDVPAGCMAECPAPPTGCTRTSVDPGACVDACKAPLPQCHYAPLEEGAVCPPLLVGRCIPPN